MTASDLAARVNEVLSVDADEFQRRVEREAEDLKAEVREGTFDNPQGIVGLEYEFYGVDTDDHHLKRVPRRLLQYIGFEKELGLHNAEMQTTPQPLSKYGLRAQTAEVQARLDAALRETRSSGIDLVSDGIWTVPPVGETAENYLSDSVEDGGVRIATNMSDAVRYHAMANVDGGIRMQLDVPHVSLSADTVMPESLITSLQPHYQVSHAPDLPDYFAYALRIAGPLLALGVNSPFVPPELYDADPETVLEEGWMESRVGIFESFLNTGGENKVRFPRDFESVEDAIDDIAADRTVVPMLTDDTGRFDDRFAHLRHTHGSYWRWVRPVFDGPTKSAANARIEFRPVPGQPTVRDTVAFLAAYAGLLESLYARDHPLRSLPWEAARDNFYAAVEDGLDGEFRWVTTDGEETTNSAVLFDELLEHARDGLALRGLSEREISQYIEPLGVRVDRGVTPASWKHDRVSERVEAGTPFDEAVYAMQTDYIENQRETLVEGSFVDWLS
ncbi:hypothetical protein [Halomarina oriensis]|uniref:Glutamate--cysteine ligase n=1 Tax=Halomarina oriensis TaxID=671145 RepID=A0A6B0GMF7_9EURY|nr:hypothetical protein [Halomarina oriensis]MWG34847.1 hypothetical protein [Halomarina oriensis]